VLARLLKQKKQPMNIRHQIVHMSLLLLQPSLKRKQLQLTRKKKSRKKLMIIGKRPKRSMKNQRAMLNMQKDLQEIT